jgi:hypothetical protein
MRIIALCISVESKGINPFEVEVQTILNTLKEYLPKWKVLDDIVLDAQTLNQIAGIVSLQGEWVIRRSTSLFVDPMLIEMKLRMMHPSRLMALFEEVWKPIVEMDGLSKKRIEEAVDYWNNLPTKEEKRINLPEALDALGTITQEELMKRRILSEEPFIETLKVLWEELKNKAKAEERIRYWDFIHASTYKETVNRAYLVSFLITYGYATIQINPLEEEIFLIPNDQVVEASSKQQAISIPIAIDRKTWTNLEDSKS